MRLGARVAAVDPAAHEVMLADGRRLGYGVLVWAAGGTPRRLPQGRPRRSASRADVDRIVAALPEREAGIGDRRRLYRARGRGGAARRSARRCVLIEAQARLLPRVAAPPISRFLRGGASRPWRRRATWRRHRADRRRSPAICVIVGIGIEPAVGPLKAAGAAGGERRRRRRILPDQPARHLRDRRLRGAGQPLRRRRPGPDRIGAERPRPGQDRRQGDRRPRRSRTMPCPGSGPTNMI